MIKMQLKGLVGALTLGSAALLGGQADAAYTYVATPTPAVTPFGQSQLTLNPVSSVTPLNGSTQVNIADVALTSQNTTGTDTITLNFSDAVVITNNGATGTITETGTLTFRRSDSGGSLSNFSGGAFTNNGINIGGTIFTLAFPSYTPPTVNNVPTGDGNLSVEIDTTTPAVVPEPASVAMLGLGLAGLAGASAFRRRSR